MSQTHEIDDANSLAAELPELRDRFRVFADAVLSGKSASQAARDAGYSHRTAGITGHKLLKRPDIAEYLRVMRAKHAASLNYDVTEWKSELKSIAHSNIEDYTRLNEDGELEVDFSRASRKQLAAVAGVKVKKRKIYDNKGNVVGEERSSEFKLWDKLRAAELLGKHSGFLAEPEQKVVIDVADRLLRARQRVLSIEDGSARGDAEG